MMALTIDSPSPEPAPTRRIGLVEAIEDVRQVLGRDARAGIRHAQVHHRSPAVRRQA